MRYRFYSALLLSSLLMGCGEEDDQSLGLETPIQILADIPSFDHAKRFSNSQDAGPICPQNSPTCFAYAEQQLLKQYAPFVQVSKPNGLVLQLYSGKTLTLTGQPESNLSADCNPCRYQLIQVYPKLDAVLVYLQYHEGGSYQLINLDTEQRLNLHGIPVLSPNLQYLISFKSDLGTSNNILQVYRFDRINGPQLSFDIFKDMPQFVELKMGFSEAKWLDSSSFIVQADVATSDGFEQQHRYYQMQRHGDHQNATWTMQQLDLNSYHALMYPDA